MASIPASAIVSVTPGVIGAGGTALDLSGLMMTLSARIPNGAVLAFPSYLAVAAYFGPTSAEAAAAAVYFKGFTSSNKKPANLLMSRFLAGAAPAYVRGGNVSALTLGQLQAINGTLSVVIDGVTKTGTVNLAGVASFTAAATAIGTALTALCNYDPLSGSFAFTSGTAGTASRIAFPTGTPAATLGLTAATGAVLSQGGVALTPQEAMNAAVAANGNWASFTTLWEPDPGSKLGFAAWTDGTINNRLYACWDSDVAATTPNNAASVGAQVAAAGYSGTAMLYGDVLTGVFLLGAVASLDFDERDGRATMAFRRSPGMAAGVTSQAVMTALLGNGYNLYGAYGTAADEFTFLYPGSVSGPFRWIDSYINEIWMSNGFQLAMMTLLTGAKSIPYNQAGYALIKAACLDPINQAVDYGAVRPGVPLSAQQAAQVNAAAGIRVDDVLSTRGWYLQVREATPQARAARKSPPCTFWYTDGQSVHALNLATVQVQ